MSKCLYCGNNPVPHRTTWANVSSVILMTPLNRWLVGTWFGRFFNWLSDGILFGMFLFFRLIGCVKWYGNREACTIVRAKVLWDEAYVRGLEMQGAKFLKRCIDFYRVKLNGKWVHFNGLPRPAEADTSATIWMDDKGLLKQKLLAANVPTPAGGYFSDFMEMREAFQQLQKPVIVKPRLGSRGRHTTTCIFTEKQLEQAFEIAKQLCYWVVMEEHLVGSVYRGTMIGGKLRGVLGGDPPRITGDGVYTIQDLVTQKNIAKSQGIKDVLITSVSLEFLERNGFNLETILPAGQTIDMTEKVGVSYGGTSYEITSDTHPDIAAMLERAAAVVGDPLMGFDFIIPDVTKAPTEQKWGIIECNGIPFINLHHFPLLGKPNNVAQYVWDLMV